jgi:hypothetical protein
MKLAVLVAVSLNWTVVAFRGVFGGCSGGLRAFFGLYFGEEVVLTGCFDCSCGLWDLERLVVDVSLSVFLVYHKKHRLLLHLCNCLLFEC